MSSSRFNWTISSLSEFTERNRANCIFEQVKKLDHEYFPFPWTSEQWDEISIFKKQTFFDLFVISNHDIVFGFSLYLSNIQIEQNHLLKICVPANLRKSGYATELLCFAAKSFASNGFSNCYLEVSTLNTCAIKFYEKHEFQNLTLKKKFYSDGSDAYAMQCFY